VEKKPCTEQEFNVCVWNTKEGLALINGATFQRRWRPSTVGSGKNCAKLPINVWHCRWKTLLARKEAFDARLQVARGMIGQMDSAKNVWDAIQGSTFINSSNHVQDGYAIRCAPQVHGAIRDSLAHAWNIITREINAATDNPLLFPNGDVISGGNFHGEPTARVMDFLGIALAELGAISERRTFRLLDSHLNNGLPIMLIADAEKAGLESGLMIPQYSAASLVMENQHLANSDAVHSLPTSANQEDHNSNSLTAARHTYLIAKNVLRILSIELYTAAHGMEIRKTQHPERKLGAGTGKILAGVRKVVTFHAHDTLWGNEIDQLLNSLEKDIFFHKMKD
jgi:histidine ammonia-lyase